MKMIRQSVLAVLMAMLIPASGQAAGIVSTVASARDDIVVSSNAEATVTATGRDDLITGNYTHNFRLGSWTASVTSGTLAYRLNRSVSPSDGGTGIEAPRYGYANNISDVTKKIKIVIGSSTDNIKYENGWVVLAQGTAAVTNGGGWVNGGQALTPGNYPIGIDVAAYAY